MFEKQKLDVGENSSAIQAAGNVTITPYLELRAIFLDLFELNFPRIQQVAKETANQRVDAMLEELKKSFEKHKNDIDPSKFADPGIQYEMQAMAVDVARKGEKSNLDLLCELFCTMMSKDCPELIELIAAEARRILPNLSSKHVNYLSLEILMNDAAFDVPYIQRTNQMVSQTLEHIRTCSQITQSDLQYVSVSGAIVARQIPHIGVTPSFLKSVAEFKGKSVEQIVEYSKHHGLHSIAELQELANKCHIGYFQLTAVGRLIGWLNLAKFSQVDVKQLFN
ncbi:TPA: LPO_1073/Vpar_1526 family protein [Vibrio cholerae]